MAQAKARSRVLRDCYSAAASGTASGPAHSAHRSPFALGRRARRYTCGLVAKMITLTRQMPFDELKEMAIYTANSLGHFPVRWRRLKRQTVSAQYPKCGGTVMVTGPQSDSPEDEPITGGLVLSACIQPSRIGRSAFQAISQASLSVLVNAPTDWRKLESCSDDEVLFRRSGAPLFE
jgi:hypothetical protein